MAQLTSPLTGTFKSIKKQFIAKEKLIKSSLVTQKKRSDNKRKNAERERFIDYERLLERKLNFLGKPIRSVGRKLGFLESLKKFIVNLLLGFIALRLLKYLPQLKGVLSTILRVGDFIIEMSGKLLNGLVTFVDKGYQAYDHAKKLIRNIGGEKAINAFDKLSDQTGSLLNSVMIAGMIFSDFGGVGRGAGPASQAINAGVETITDTLKNEAKKQVAKQGLRVALAPAKAAGIVLGAGLLASAIGEGAFQVKKLGKGLQGWIAGKINEASQDKNPITRFLKKGFFGWMQGILGPAIWILNGTGVLFDVIGAPFRYGIELIRAAFMKLNDDKKGLDQQNKNLGKFDARIRDGIREHFSVLSPLFNFVGMSGVSNKLQTPGSFGSLYGEKAAKDMGYYNGGLVVKKFAGGGYTGDEKEKKKPTIPRTINEAPGTLKPGSAVGGELAIKKVFPVGGGEVMDQYGYVTSAYNNMSSYMGSIGPLMSLTTKALLGDVITNKDYRSASDSLTSFLNAGMYEENLLVYQKINSTIDSETLSSVVSGEVTKSLRNKMGEIQNLLRTQIGLYPLPGPATGSESDVCEVACDTDGGSGFAVSGDSTDKAILDLISSVEAKDYDTMNVSRGATAGKPTQMTVDWLVANANGAIGRYQQMPQYLKERVIAAGGKGSDKFTPELQDKTALKMLYSGHGFARWRNGQMSDEEFGNRLSATWRGLPHSSGGTYPDQYAGRNKAHMSRPAFMTRLAQIKAGGGATTAKIAPGAPAASVSDCICDPETPSGNPGTLPPPVKQPAGGHIVTSSMGMRGFALSPGMHMGVDISGNIGEYLKAFTSGKVEATGYDSGYGNYVNWIDSFGVAHFYAHMDKPAFVKPGQTVSAGTVLGVLGSTGRSSGPHLHWEVSTNPRDTGQSKAAVLSRFNPLSRYSKESPFTGSRQSGGPTLTGGLRLLHKGEYVIDKDSVELFGGVSFYNMINGVEDEKQRTQKSSELMKHLSKYTGRKIDQRPEIIIDEGDNLVLMSPPTVIPGFNSSGSGSGSEVNWEQDMCYARG